MSPKLWQLLNGIKLALGVALYHTADQIPDPNWAMIAKGAGAILMGVGVTHDAVKYVASGPDKR